VGRVGTSGASWDKVKILKTENLLHEQSFRFSEASKTPASPNTRVSFFKGLNFVLAPPVPIRPT